MCLNPKKIRNKARTLSMEGGQPFYVTVPCNHCAECLAAKRQEWNFRTWYEVLSTIDDGGYVLFDTLTYRDEDVPHVSDVLDFKALLSLRQDECILRGDSELKTAAILNRYEKQLNKINNMCFNKEDIKLFFKRLRRQLQYKGFKSSDAFKYFLTSEYGTSDKGTHRPHYHVLFFVKDPMLHPLTLSSLINKCWQLGRTDGINYHTAPYVFNHVYGYKGLQLTTNSSFNVSGIQAACSYVSKYITKDSRYQKIAENRAKRIMTIVFGSQWEDDFLNTQGFDKRIKRLVPADDEIPWDSYETIVEHYSKFEVKRLYNGIRRSMEQFHLESNNFGADFLRYNTYDSVKSTGLISRVDPKRGIVTIPIPRYYQYKIFYDLKRDFNNHLFWSLNDEGKEFRMQAFDRSFDSMTRKMEDWITSMHSMDYYCDLPQDEAQTWYMNVIGEFDRLCGDRPIKDFVEYLLFYKGRIKTKEQVEREENGEFRVMERKEWMPYMFRDITVDTDVLYNYNTPTDEEQLGCKFISKKYYGDAEFWQLSGTPLPYDIFVKDMEYHTAFNYFEDKYVISDKSDPKFENYDKMYDLYCEGQKFKNKFLQSAFTNKENSKIKFKESTLFKIV